MGISKIRLYNKIFKYTKVLLQPDEMRAAQILSFEKLITITKDYARIASYCDGDYKSQYAKNERMFKTLIKGYQMDGSGDIYMKNKLTLGFHIPIPRARQVFFDNFPEDVEDGRYYVEVEYTYLNEKENRIRTVHSTKDFDHD